MTQKIPAGTRIYLTKKGQYSLYIRPNKVLLNDSLYVAYDVKINGEIIIPKNTRVIGNWVTESNPTFTAQLQLTKIFLCGPGQDIAADSDIINQIAAYNNTEINNANYLYKRGQFKMPSNIVRRIAHYNCNTKMLPDHKLNTPYIEISTKEIPVILLSDFIKEPCNIDNH